MARFRLQQILVALIVLAVVCAALLWKGGVALRARDHVPEHRNEADVPHEIELEQTAELLRAAQSRQMDSQGKSTTPVRAQPH